MLGALNIKAMWSQRLTWEKQQLCTCVRWLYLCVHVFLEQDKLDKLVITTRPGLKPPAA